MDSINGNKVPNFKVIIAGGSVAGLILAHSLSRAGIDYIVLESGSDLAPQAGASVGILPNGCRILEQLGLYDDIYAQAVPIEWGHLSDANGVEFGCSDLFQLMQKRLGYPTIFLERQAVLRVFANHLQEKHKVHVNKRVVRIEHSEKGVTVFTKDGSEYTGDMVVGADGVHSIVRSEMWRHADLLKPGFVPSKEKTAMTVEYSGIFGISNPVPGLEEGHSSIASNHGFSFMCIVGKGARVFWFIFTKLDKKYTYPDCPRFTKKDVEEYAPRYLNNKVGKASTFGDVWEKRVDYAMTVLEEGILEHWNFGRIVCLGDSVHKMTPNFGQGGNCAIESAAGLANSLHRLIYCHKNPDPTTDELSAYLQEFSDSRKPRIHKIYKVSALATRTQATDGLFNGIKIQFMLKVLGDIPLNWRCDLFLAAVKLNYLPLPERSRNGWMPFDGNLGVTKKPNPFRRAMEASVFLVLFGVAIRLIWVGQYVNGTTDLLQKVISVGKWESGDGRVIPIRDVYIGIPAADTALRKLITSILPSVFGLDHIQRLQMISFIGELIPVYTIWTIEAFRSGNRLTLVNLAMPFALAYQRYGFGVAAPLYYFLHYVQTSYHNYASLDLRVIQSNCALTIIPTVLFSLALPAILMFSPLDFSSDSRQAFTALWLLFPILFPILHWGLTRLVPDNTKAEKKTPGVDIPILRRTYIFVGVISAMVHLYIRSSSLSGYEVFFAGVRDPLSPVTSVVDGIGKAAKLNYLLGFGSSLLWAAMTLHDLKKFGRTGASLTKIVSFLAAGTVVFGPGAAMAASWMWRENILSKRRTGKEGQVLAQE